jgi:hypothetical protein
VTLLWIIVTVSTIGKAIYGDLLFAPYLKDIEGEEVQGRRHLRELDYTKLSS